MSKRVFVTHLNPYKLNGLNVSCRITVTHLDLYKLNVSCCVTRQLNISVFVFEVLTRLLKRVVFGSAISVLLSCLDTTRLRPADTNCQPYINPSTLNFVQSQFLTIIATDFLNMVIFIKILKLIFNL